VRRRRRIGLCVAAAAVSCAVAAGPASAALPEFIPGAGVPFTVKSGKTILETVGKQKLTCLADTGAGEIIGPKNVTVVFVFSGCEHKKVMCNTPGVGPGEVVLQASGLLGYLVNPGIKTVGIDLSNPTGAPLMQFSCGAALRGFVVGSVIGQLTPVNKLVKPPASFSLKFSEAGGKQKITKLFAEPVDVPMTSYGGPLEESGLASTESISFKIPVKVVA
jgi:hypothetical protein